MPDFAGAARRHLRDADLLYQGTKLANADHLAGYSAECAIKSLVCAVTGVTPPSGGPPTVDSQQLGHLPQLWGQGALVLQGRVLAGPAVRAGALLAQANPFVV